MAGPDRARVKAVFAQVVDAPAAERPALLVRLCGVDVGLRERVAALLRADDDQSGLLDNSALAAIADGGGPDTRPVRIGSYEVLGAIGVGGMGEVYEARQESPNRVVAVKLIHAGAATPAVMRRFQREAEALGRLEHVGIARVYEAGQAAVHYDNGVAAQLPYLAMERVNGDNLLAHTNRLTTVNDRLALLARVADAVQYAHQRGVIHRDLKPSNVLVEADGQPKVLDFGVASLTETEVEASLHVTMPGQIVGTLAYMSPEQMSGTQQVDTRTDVYALGVIAYEMLSGRQPIDLESSSLVEAARRIADVEPSNLGLLAPSCRGDVATVVQKALAKDPGERYQTVGEFAADLRRILAREPITARAPSAWYVARKFAARHRALVTSVAVVFVTLVGGIVASWMFAVSADEQRGYAERETLRAQTSSSFMESMLLSIRPEVARELDTQLLERILASTVERLDAGELAAEPEIEGDLRLTIGRTYERISQFEKAADCLSKAAAAFEKALGATHRKTMLAVSDQSAILMTYHEFEAAALVLDDLERRLRIAPGDQELMRAQYEVCRGRVRNGLGDHAGAVPHFENALAIYLRHDEGESSRVVSVRSNLVGVYVDAGRHDEAIAMYGHLIADARQRAKRTPKRSSLPLATLLSNLASCCISAGRPAEGEAAAREALGLQTGVLPPTHLSLGITLHNLGDALLAQCPKDSVGADPRAAESADFIAQSLTIFEGALPPEHQFVVETRHRLGQALAADGRFAAAVECVEAAHTRQVESANAVGASATAGVLAELFEQWHAQEPAAERERAAARWQQLADG